MKKKLLLLTVIPLLLACKKSEETFPSQDPTGGTVDPTHHTPTPEPTYNPDDPVVDPNHLPDEIDKDLSKKNDQFNGLFDYTAKIEIELDFTNQSILKLREYGEGEGNDNFVQNEMYHPCTGKITINGVTNIYHELGVRMKGNTSRDTEFIDDSGHFVEGHYCHFKLNFAQTFDSRDDNDYYIKSWSSTVAKKAREDRKFGGMKKLDMKWNRNYDESFTKETYVLDAFRNEGVLAQHSNIVQLTIKSDVDSRTMIYQVAEAVDKQLVKKVFTDDYSGDFYKCCYTDMGRADLKDYNYRKIGVEGTRYRPVYNLKTNEKTSDHARMKAFIDIFQTTKGQDANSFYNQIQSYLDVDNFLKYSALCWVFGLPDDLKNNFNNYFIYFNKENKAYFLPYDNDRCLGIKNGWDKDCKNAAWDDKYAIGSGTEEQSPIIFRLVTGGSTNSYPVHEASKEQYHQYCIEYANKYLDTSKFNTFTQQFHYSSKSISDGGPENDSFEIYAYAKKNTLK